MRTQTAIELDPTIQAFIEKLESQKAPPIYTLTPANARLVLEKLQSQTIETPRVLSEEKKIPVGPDRQISVRIFRPLNHQQTSPAILFIHGAGWVMGSAETHNHLARALCEESQSTVVFVNYSRSPEVRFPTAIEECYTVLIYLAQHGREWNIDPTHLSVAGDSVGGNMSIAMTLLAKERKGPKIHSQVLFYPVTNADLNSHSYHEFANGPWLTKSAMEWFWNAYEPNIQERNDPLLSPLKASIELLKGLPRALVITAEYDVLRDEGEAYAHRLMQAGVKVTAIRFLGMIHDFVMLNALANTSAAQEAIALAGAFLKKN